MRQFGTSCVGAIALGLFFAEFTIAAVVALPYSQNFSTPATGLTAVEAAYPSLTLNNSNNDASDFVAGGVLSLNVQATGNFYPSQAAIAWVTPTLNNASGDIFVSADITANNSNGNYNVGLTLGDAATGTEYERIVFHPGFPGGAFRIEPGGVGSGNTDMGYEPFNNDPQLVQLDINKLGVVNITITDSANSSNVFTASFTDPLAYGASVGLVRSQDYQQVGFYGEFSNFSITQAPVPEPSALVLASLAALGLACASRRRRALARRARAA